MSVVMVTLSCGWRVALWHSVRIVRPLALLGRKSLMNRICGEFDRSNVLLVFVDVLLVNAISY